MSVTKSKNTVSTEGERRFGEHLSAAVESMRVASSEIMQARKELSENYFELSWPLIKVSAEVKRLRNRLYRTGYIYWLEKINSNQALEETHSFKAKSARAAGR